MVEDIDLDEVPSQSTKKLKDYEITTVKDPTIDIQQIIEEEENSDNEESQEGNLEDEYPEVTKSLILSKKSEISII